MLLDIQNVSKFFPEKNGSFFSQQKATQALDDVRLSIAEGSFFGLFGSSGSGKTTLLQILTKRLFPDSGNVLFQNNNIFLQSRSEEQDFFREVQMISSEPPDFFSRRKSMSVLLEKQWQSHFPEKDISEHKTAIRHIVHMLELPLSHLHKMPSECTRDEILRFSLARAFLLEAKVILFDDPIRDFSIPAQEEIFSLLLQRQDEIPITYVYATICSDIIQEICTDFAFLEKGRIIQE